MHFEIRALRSILLSLVAAAPLLQAAPPANAYVDARACAKCHLKIDQSYRLTGMGRSLYKPSPTTTIGNDQNTGEFVHKLSDTHYAMSVRDGSSYQRRWQLGFDGKETNVEELKIDYVIGSGNHSRSYLHRASNGGYIELPLSWYSERGGYWAMSPGFDSRHPPTRRFASYECVFCHDAYPKIPLGHESPDSDPVFNGELPQGIDCQRCHGPGGNHLRVVQSAGSKPSDIRASIVNPSRLPPALQMDVCLQCHLEPTSSGIPALIRRFNRGPFSFKPGEPLANFLLAFDHAPATGHDDKFEIVNSSAYRLRQSQCFLKSGQAMTCLTCHDPHDVPRGAQAVSRYSAACRQCHASEIDSQITAGHHPATVECISCHMPKRRTDDVVHVVVTDHLIQRRPPSRNLLADLPERHPAQAEEYRGEIVPYYPSPFPATDENKLYLAVAQVALRNNLEAGIPDLTRELNRLKPPDPQFYFVLGEAWRNSARPLEAVAAYQRALQIKPGSAHTLLALSTALKASNQVPRAAETLRRALAIFPHNVSVWFQSGATDYELGRQLEAIGKMEKAVALDPDLTGARRGLADLLGRKGQTDRSEIELRGALALDPYDAESYDLLGRTLSAKGQRSESLFDFERAARLQPEHAAYSYDFALALSSVNRLEDAQTWVVAALGADANMAEAHALFGGLLAARRQFPAAAHQYTEAIRLNPGFGRARLDLARLLIAQGDTAGATQQLREASHTSDPQVAQLARQTLQSLGQQ